jgi:hypothetical protein
MESSAYGSRRPRRLEATRKIGERNPSRRQFRHIPGRIPRHRRSSQHKAHSDRASIRADGEDVSVVNVTALDAQDREVPIADDLIRFGVSGPARIIGVGNGDPSSHELDKYLDGGVYQRRRLFNGKCQVIVQGAPEVRVRWS